MIDSEDEESVSDAEPSLWDGSYQKRWYEVTTESGEKVTCWPNAGIMNSTDGSGREWRPEDRVLVRRISDEEAMPWYEKRRAAAKSAELRKIEETLVEQGSDDVYEVRLREPLGRKYACEVPSPRQSLLAAHRFALFSLLMAHEHLPSTMRDPDSDLFPPIPLPPSPATRLYRSPVFGLGNKPLTSPRPDQYLPKAVRLARNESIRANPVKKAKRKSKQKAQRKNRR